MNDLSLAKKYAPMIHFDRKETIPLLKVGYSIIRRSAQSPSFRRLLALPSDAKLMIEYAYYWDFDIQHMYDLEHIWVTVGHDGEVVSAQASFHGKFFNLFDHDLPFALPPEGRHVHAFCQPGKHAFLPDGRLFRLVPEWYESCNIHAGGGVLVGGPFQGIYEPTEQDNALSQRYIKENLTFYPSLEFVPSDPEALSFIPWHEMFEWIPPRIRQMLEAMRVGKAADTKRLQEL